MKKLCTFCENLSTPGNYLFYSKKAIIVMKIGDRIRSKRLELGLSQNDIAKACDWVSVSRVCNYEHNLREPQYSDIVKISNALRVNPSWLLFGEGTGDDKNLPISSFFYKNLKVITMEETQNFLNGNLENIKTSPFISDKKEFKGRQNIFFTIMKGDSMVSAENSKQSCSDGDMLLVDPDMQPKGGDLALIIDDCGFAKVRKLYKDGSEDIFLPLNQHYKSLNAEKAKKIVGTILMIQKVLVD